jgi:hypothetical protein
MWVGLQSGSAAVACKCPLPTAGGSIPSDAILLEATGSILQMSFMDIQFESFGEGHSGKIIDCQALNLPENKIKYVIRRHSMIVL